MIQIGNEEKAKSCLLCLKKHFEDQNIEEVASVNFPHTLQYNSKEWLNYIFYSCLLDYGMRSKIYHKNLIETFYKYPEIFDPNYVVKHYKKQEDELLIILKNHIHPRYPNVALKKWICLSEELTQYDLFQKIKSFHNFNEIEQFIKSIKGYGQKTGGLLLRLISESDLCDFDDQISVIPLDRHDLEISYLNHIIPSKNLTPKQIHELSDLLIDVGKKINLSSICIDKYLWEIGNTFCNKNDCCNCPLYENCETKGGKL